MERMGQYDRQQLADFFNYWSQENADGKMMFEKERFWNIDNRLKRWVKNQYSAANSAAAIRLKRLQKKDDTSRLQSQAAERERAEARMERERAEQRKNAVSYEEYLAMKEKNVEC